jgi:hypothetical protein
MRFDDISEGVAGPQKCWPGHRKIGTQPGTGKNAGKRVNKCKKIGEGVGDDVADRDVGEYDREGEMAMGQLKTAEDAAAELRSILDADENLPEWVQSKITKAVDYLDTVRDYMKSKEQGVAEGADSLEPFDRGVINHMQDNSWLSAERAYFRMIGLQKKRDTRPSEYEKMIQRYIDLYDKYKGQQDVAEGDGISKDQETKFHAKLDKLVHDTFGKRKSEMKKEDVAEANYYNPMDQDRREQDAMDASKRGFKRAELDFEYQRERELAQQRQQAEQGPWYLRIDGKVYRQKGQPKVFTSKKGANGYALAIIKNRPELQGKIMLTKSDQDQ